MDKNVVTIVSGLPRSGTSMTMKMLEAGGLPVFVDNIRTADEDNPKGYYELEKVKQIESDKSWLPDAKGKVVKMVSELLKHLPADHKYKIVFMRRKIEETLASQQQMLIRRGEPTDKVSDEKMTELFRKHLVRLAAWIEKQPNIEILYVNYSDAMANPTQEVKKINDFLGGGLNMEAMAAVADPKLYRQRR
jgi:argonaute-like protein implicated in RNA metabolism and viral defense